MKQGFRVLLDTCYSFLWYDNLIFQTIILNVKLKYCIQKQNDASKQLLLLETNCRNFEHKEITSLSFEIDLVLLLLGLINLWKMHFSAYSVYNYLMHHIFLLFFLKQIGSVSLIPRISNRKACQCVLQWFRLFR